MKISARTPFASFLLLLSLISSMTGCAFLPDVPPRRTTATVTTDRPLALCFSHSVGTGAYFIRFRPQNTEVHATLKIAVENTGNHSLTALTGRWPMGSAHDSSEYLKPGQSFQIFDGSASEFFEHWREIMISSPDRGPLPVRVTIFYKDSPSPLMLHIEAGLEGRPCL